MKTAKEIKGETTYYFVLINKKGGLLLINGQLPIFWKKKVAVAEAKTHGATVHPVFSLDIINAIINQPI